MGSEGLETNAGVRRFGNKVSHELRDITKSVLLEFVAIALFTVYLELFCVNCS